jgi:type VI secretion system protein ImpK
MREELANLVYPVFSAGLRLKARLQGNEVLNLNDEQSALKRLLRNEMEARQWADYGGEGGPDGPGGVGAFLGIRYALVCWLDEIFILDSVWSRQWNEQALERALYGTRNRSELFWEQAGRAESRPGTDAIEGYFLGVMLGFRGELREEPDRLQAWADSTQARIARGLGQEWPAPPEHEPPTDVPPRHGRERLERMVVVACVLVLVLIPILAMYVVGQIFGDH